MTERERIGAHLTSLRKEKGLTQAELAERCGMQKQHISRIEHGLYSVGIEILAKIGSVLGRKVDLVQE